MPERLHQALADCGNRPFHLPTDRRKAEDMCFRITEKVSNCSFALAGVVSAQIVERRAHDRDHEMLDAGHLLKRPANIQRGRKRWDGAATHSRHASSWNSVTEEDHTLLRIAHDTSDGESGTTAKNVDDTTRPEFQESNPEQFLLTPPAAAHYVSRRTQPRQWKHFP